MNVRTSFRNFMHRMSISNVADRGIRLGIRFRFIVLVTALFIAFAGLIFYLFSERINSIIVNELQNRVNIQVDYLNGYGIVLLGNQDRKSLDSLLQPILADDDVEYLLIQKLQNNQASTQKEIKLVYSRFKSARFRTRILAERPTFKDGKAERKQSTIGGWQIIQTAIPVYQEEMNFNSLGDLDSLFGEESSMAAPEEPTVAKKKLVGWILYGVSTSNANQQIRRMNWETLKFGMFFLVAVIFLIYMIISYGFNPLLKMADIAGEIAKGNLSARVPFSADDEIGDLAASFNKMVDHLGGVIERIQKGSRRMQMVSRQIAASTDQVRSGATLQSQGIDGTLAAVEKVNSSIKEISENINLLSQSAEESSASTYELNETIKEVDDSMEFLSESVGETVLIVNETSEMLKQNVASVENLRASIEETASSMSQVDVSINEIKDHSKASAEIARVMYQEAADGKQAVDKTITGLGAIEKFSENMGMVIGGLEGKSKEIAQIVDVIYDVADQTNLLALNASIIAAQAGGKGRAFAVVATQIKELSNRTTESIQQISRLINSVQEEVHRTAEAMKVGERAILEGTQVAGSAGESLSQILDKAGQVVNMSQEIEKSTAEHARGAHQVKNATEQVKDMVAHMQENIQAQEQKNVVLREASSKMREISVHVKGTTREQSAGSRLITDAMEKITAMVHQIDNSIKEQQESTGGVVTSAVQIRQIADQTQESMIQLDEVVSVLGEQIQVLTEIVDEFTVTDERSDP